MVSNTTGIRLSRGILNFSFDDDADRYEYKSISEASGTKKYIESLRILNETPCDDLSGYTRPQLEDAYNKVFGRLIEARIETAELRSLLFCLDRKISRVDTFTPDHKPLRHHKGNRSTKNQEPHLRLVKK